MDLCDARQVIDLLRDFNSKVGRLERTSFAKRFAEDLPQVFMTFEELEVTHLGGGRLNFYGKLKSWVPDFKEDEIDAFVLTYRMLTQNNDRLSIAQIAKLYEAEWMPKEAATGFCEAREHLNNYLDSAASLQFGETQISIRQLVDVVLYGGLAHSNKSKAEVFKAWAANPAISGLMWVEFQAAMAKALYVFKFLRRLSDALIEAMENPPNEDQ